MIAERSGGLGGGVQTGRVGAAERPASPLAAGLRTRVDSRGLDVAHPWLALGCFSGLFCCRRRGSFLPGFPISIS